MQQKSISAIARKHEKTFNLWVQKKSPVTKINLKSSKASESTVYSEHMNDWQYLSQLIFPQKEILRFSCALTFNYGHVTKN